MTEDILRAEEVLVIESPSKPHKIKFVNYNGQIISLEGCSKVEFVVDPNEIPSLTLTYLSKPKRKVV